MSIGLAIIGITSLIGAVWIVYHIIIPLIDAIAYSIGFTIFEILHIKVGKGIRHPIKVIIYILKNFMNGFITRTCDFGTTQHVKTDKWKWKPYFHYERLDKEKS